MQSFSPKHPEYIFFTINSEKYENELHKDGVVFQPDADKVLVKTSEITDKADIIDLKKKIRVLVRYHDEGQASFEFIGIATGIARYDQTRNKIFVEKGKPKGGEKVTTFSEGP